MKCNWVNWEIKSLQFSENLEKFWISIVKENLDEFNKTTYACLYMIANISNLIAPILPDSSKKIKNMLQLPEYKWEEIEIKGNYKINNLEILYSRIDSIVE